MSANGGGCSALSDKGDKVRDGLYPKKVAGGVPRSVELHLHLQ